MYEYWCSLTLALIHVFSLSLAYKYKRSQVSEVIATFPGLRNNESFLKVPLLEPSVHALLRSVCTCERGRDIKFFHDGVHKCSPQTSGNCLKYKIIDM